MGASLSSLDYEEDIQKAIIVSPEARKKAPEKNASDEIVTALPYIERGLSKAKTKSKTPKLTKRALVAEERRSKKINGLLAKERKLEMQTIRVLFMGLCKHLLCF